MTTSQNIAGLVVPLGRRLLRNASGTAVVALGNALCGHKQAVILSKGSIGTMCPVCKKKL